MVVVSDALDPGGPAHLYLLPVHLDDPSSSPCLSQLGRPQSRLITVLGVKISQVGPPAEQDDSITGLERL